MFTGIVTELGRVRSLTDDVSSVLTLTAPRTAPGARIGGSIAVDGVCLTVTEIAGDLLQFDVMPQTLRLTTLARLRPGDQVNLEAALAATGRLDGHVVQGHVDGVATLRSRAPGSRWDELQFNLPAHLRKYVAPQGSIALAGVSLTVTEVDRAQGPGFSVALIPTTLAETTLGELQVGDSVNVEVDVLAKYVARILEFR